jgi:hypothetical protein
MLPLRVEESEMKVVLICCALILASSPAFALCKDDLVDLRPKVTSEKYRDKERYGAALMWLNKAAEAEPTSELNCLNYLVKSRKALAGIDLPKKPEQRGETPDWEKTMEERRNEGSYKR